MSKFSISIKTGLIIGFVLTAISLQTIAQSDMDHRASSNHPGTYNTQSEHSEPTRRTQHRESGYRQEGGHSQRFEHQKRRSRGQHYRGHYRSNVEQGRHHRRSGH